MKHKRRLIGLLLVVAVMVGIVITAVSADSAVKITNIGSSGNLAGIPAVVPAENVTYLSDIYNTSAKVYSYVVPKDASSPVRDFALDQNFFGTRVYAFSSASDSNRQEVKQGTSKVDAEGYRVLNNGVKAHYSDIILGRNATIFDKGLAFQPSAKDAADQATVIFDVRSLDADYFYAVAGMTGEGNKSQYQRKIDFELYGSKDTAYSANMSFEKLAYAEGICAWLMGEFNIPISDYNFIKLVAVTKVSNSAADSVWADACVYKLPTTDFSVSINWDDTYNPTAIRPDGDLTVQLYADGVAVDGETAALNAGNGWSADFFGLDKYQEDLATEIVYTAVLSEDPALHRLVSSANGVMTYQYDATLTTKDIPVSLVWSDEDAGGRADEVTIQLYADGVAQTGKTVALSKSNDWSATFTKLPEKKRVSDSETADIVYTFKVLTRVNNYTSSIAENEGSIVVTMTYSASNAQKFSNIGKSGTLEGIPSEATGANTHYLTDLLNGRNKKVVSQYIANGGKYKSFENYEGKVQVIYGSGAKQELVENADTVVNGVTYQPTDIVLGANGAVYSDGLSFMVSDPAQDDTYITYNLTGMNATNFYAVAGITGAANDLISKECYLTFEVWGSKDGATYEKLGYAEQIRSYLLAEFNVDITGYNYLKLTAYNTGNSSVGASAVWADALVYCSVSSAPSQPSEPTEPTPTEPKPEDLPGKYTASSDGTYAGIKAAENSVVYLSEASATDATKGKYITSWYVSPKGGVGESRYPSLDYPFTKTSNDPIVVGAKSTRFQHGLGVLPVAGTSGQKTYIILDISSISDVDRFYAVAGITGTGVDKDGNSYGVVFEVYGSEKVTTSENDASFKKLAVSGDIFQKNSGEFDVDITGMKTLKLVTLVADSNKGRNNSNTQSIWADACVYKYDENGTAPTDPTEPEDKLTDSGDVDTSKPINYTESKDGAYAGITKAAKDSYVALSDAKYVIDSYILPSATNPNRTVRIDTVDLNNDGNSSAIIGAKKTKFDQHLTMHPNTLGADTYSYAELDLTGLDVDRFYSAVGIHSPKNDIIGVVFNVFGYDTAKSDYVLLGTSSDVHGGQSGEFDIDISGYKKLKIEVALASDSTDHYSRISSWCNIAVYKYDENGSAPSVPEKDPLPGVYTPSASGAYKWISDAKNSAVTYLSKLVYTDSSNSSAGKPTTKNEPYGEAGKKIIIGEKNTGFTYGLGVHPKSGSAQAYTIYDLSGLNVDRFYSAVGITNANGKNGSSKGVIFQVYADYEGDGSYKLLAESDTITKKASGEFHVDISGAKSLKLVTLSATGDHASSASAWAAACVYKYDAKGGRPTSHTTVGASNTTTTTDNTGLKPTAGFTPSPDGEYTGVDKKHTRSIVYLSDLEYLEASNTTNSANPNGQPTTLDHPYNDLTTLIIIGEDEHAFHKGLGVHPKNPKSPVNGSIQSWTTYDISELDADRFYAAVGITNDKGKEGASKGVIFRVYADYGDGSFKQLAHSGCLAGRESGEFDLDITGVKTLKLCVESASTANTSSASAWANACVYDSKSVTEGVGKPVIKQPTVVPPDPTEATEPVADIPVEETTASPVMIAGIAVICVLGLLAIVLSILLAVKSKKTRK